MQTQYPHIAHTYDPETIEHGNRFATRFFSRTIEGGWPRVFGLEHLLSIPADASVVLASVHKSHADYLIEPVVLNHSGLPLPLPDGSARPVAVAAGDNLFKRVGKWDFDRMLRKAGAYKIIRQASIEQRRRILEDQQNYTVERVEAGDWFVLFPERGRSYTGEIKRFDTASIGMFLGAEIITKRPVRFVPVGISYERVAEDRFFPILDKHRKRRDLAYYALDWPMIFAQQYLHHLNPHPFGHVVVRFGKPIASEEFPDSKKGRKDQLTARLEADCRSLVKALPTALFATALTETQNKKEALKRIRHYHTGLDMIDATWGPDNPRGIAERAMRFFDRPFRRFVRDDGDSYTILRPDVIAYYANTIKHLTDKCRCNGHASSVSSENPAKAF